MHGRQCSEIIVNSNCLFPKTDVHYLWPGTTLLIIHRCRHHHNSRRTPTVGLGHPYKHLDYSPTTNKPKSELTVYIIPQRTIIFLEGFIKHSIHQYRVLIIRHLLYGFQLYGPVRAFEFRKNNKLRTDIGHGTD